MGLTKANALARGEKFAEIYNDLANQLERNGTIGKYYYDLVSDYMELWIVKSLLVRDIRERGVTVKYNNGGGQKGMKKNDSVSELLKVNAQMLKSLSDLGIKPSSSEGDEDEEEM